MARAARVASLPESHFWELTPGEVDNIMREAVEEWQVKVLQPAAYNAAVICSTLANCHRDPKKKPDPFTPADWLPKPKPAPKPDLPPAAVADKARNTMRMCQAIIP